MPRKGNIFADDIFVGRIPELSYLCQAMSETVSGRGQMFLLTGEPGIGKTRLAEELIARSGDLRRFWGRCFESGGMPPFWPWKQLITSYIDSTDSQSLLEDVGTDAPMIADLVPAMREKIPDLSEAENLGDPISYRFRLFGAVTAFIRRSCRRHPILLILEDIHWADESSLLLLEYLVHVMATIPVLVIATCRSDELRDSHRLTSMLSSLTKERHFHRIPLSPLDFDEVKEYVEAATGSIHSESILLEIFDKTYGNPLFVREVVRWISQNERVKDKWDTAGHIGIPEGVRSIIVDRVSRLSEISQKILTVAALIGHKFSYVMVSRVMNELSGDRLLDAFESPLSFALLAELPTETGQYQFTHELIRETLIESLPHGESCRLHRRIAEALEDEYGDRACQHAAEIVRHYLEGEAGTHIDRIVDYLILAGQEALSAYADEEALEYFTKARDIMEVREDDSISADIDFGLGRYFWRIGSRKEALIYLERSLSHYERIDNLAPMVNLTYQPLQPHSADADERQKIIGHLEKALKKSECGSIERGWLLHYYGFLYYLHTLDRLKACEALEEALSIAKTEAVFDLEMYALVYLGHIHSLEGDHANSLRLNKKAINLEDQAKDLIRLFYAHSTVASDLLVMGKLSESIQHSEKCLAFAQSAGAVGNHLRPLFLSKIQQVCHHRGDWQEARSINERGLQADPSSFHVLTRRVLLECEAGSAETLDKYCVKLQKAVRSDEYFGFVHPHLQSAVAFAHTALHTNVETYLETAMDFIDRVSDRKITPDLSSMVNQVRGIEAVIRRDEKTARESHEVLRPYAGQLIPPFFITSSRLLGLLAQTFKDHKLAIDHFAENIDFCRSAGLRTELAWTLYDLSGALIERNREGDADKARSRLKESHAIVKHLGMPILEARIKSRSERIRTAGIFSEDYPDGLTQREVEVLRLLLIGMTNQEIADRLFISVKTAANHVSHILEKTKTGNRTEAAAYAIRHHLNDEG